MLPLEQLELRSTGSSSWTSSCSTRLTSWSSARWEALLIICFLSWGNAQLLLLPLEQLELHALDMLHQLAHELLNPLDQLEPEPRAPGVSPSFFL